MPTKSELEIEVVKLQGEITTLKAQLLDGADEAFKAENITLTKELGDSNKLLQDTLEIKEALGAEIDDLKTEVYVLEHGAEDTSEKTVKLYWPHPVTTVGSAPSTYGYPLVVEGDNFFANVPESRVEMELKRGFVSELA